jgi:hypothetical protein
MPTEDLAAKAPVGVRPLSWREAHGTEGDFDGTGRLRMMQLTAASEQVLLGRRLRRCENKTIVEHKRRVAVPEPRCSRSSCVDPKRSTPVLEAGFLLREHERDLPMLTAK